MEDAVSPLTSNALDERHDEDHLETLALNPNGEIDCQS